MSFFCQNMSQFQKIKIAEPLWDRSGPGFPKINRKLVDIWIDARQMRVDIYIFPIYCECASETNVFCKFQIILPWRVEWFFGICPLSNDDDAAVSPSLSSLTRTMAARSSSSAPVGSAKKFLKWLLRLSERRTVLMEESRVIPEGSVKRGEHWLECPG